MHVNIIINTNSDKSWTMVVPWSNGKSITYSYKSIKDFPNVVNSMSVLLILFDVLLSDFANNSLKVVKCYICGLENIFFVQIVLTCTPL